MKKIIILIIGIIFTFSLIVACSNKDRTESVESNSEPFSESNVTSESVSESESNDTEMISFVESEIEISVGNTYQIKIASLPKGAKPQWSVSDESIATVNQSGVVTAKSIGEVVVFAEVSEYVKASCNIVVKQILIPSYAIEMMTTTTQIFVGQELILNVKVRYGDIVLSNPSLIWTSSNTDVVTIDKNGKIIGVSKGSAKITVGFDYAGGHTEKECVVTVI